MALPMVKSTSAQPTTSHPAANPVQGEGVMVVMYAAPGLTDPSLLKVPFYFQCPPLDDLTRTYAYSWTTYTTLRKGDYIQPTGRQLTTLSFNTLFVDFSPTWAFSRRYGGIPDPANNLNYEDLIRVTDELVAIMDSGTPFGLTVVNHHLWRRPDVHWAPKHGNAAVLTQLDISEREGEVDARYIAASFQEYRDPVLSQRAKGPGNNRDAGRGRELPLTLMIDRNGKATTLDNWGTSIRTIIASDASLRDICKHYYGEQSLWRALAKANGVNFGGDRSLGEFVRQRKDKQIKLIVPRVATIRASGSGSTLGQTVGSAAGN